MGWSESGTVLIQERNQKSAFWLLFMFVVIVLYFLVACYVAVVLCLGRCIRLLLCCM